MEYRKNPDKYDSKVVEIQSMLNKALDNAVLLVKADSSLPSMLGDPHFFQTLHHRNYVPNGWNILNSDGYFGSITENTVKCFQEFLYITQNGIVGNTTYTKLKELSSINSCNIQILGEPFSQNSERTFNKIILSDDLTMWKDGISAVNNFISIFNLSTIVAVSETTINISWKNLWWNIVVPMFYTEMIKIGDLIYQTTPNFKYKKFIKINQGGRYVSDGNVFKGYKIGILKKYSKVIDAVKSRLLINELGTAFGYLDLAFEWARFGETAFKGNLKVIDIGEIAVKTATTVAEPLHDWLIGTSSVSRKVSVNNVVKNLGNVITKTKYAKIVSNVGAKAGITSAAVGSSSAIAIVGFQCVGSFMMGWELGKFLESKSHLGEKTINILWGTFLGDWINDFIDWKVNRVVCIQYPADWTDTDIEKFQNRLEN